MFIQIAAEKFVNTDRVSSIVRSGTVGSADGISYIFYSENKNIVGQSEFGSLYNSDIEKALAKLMEY